MFRMLPAVTLPLPGKLHYSEDLASGLACRRVCWRKAASRMVDQGQRHALTPMGEPRKDAGYKYGTFFFIKASSPHLGLDEFEGMCHDVVADQPIIGNLHNLVKAFEERHHHRRLKFDVNCLHCPFNTLHPLWHIPVAPDREHLIVAAAC
jgi:hypothetical protein